MAQLIQQGSPAFVHSRGNLHQQSGGSNETARSRICCARRGTIASDFGYQRFILFARDCCGARRRGLDCRGISPFTTKTIKRCGDAWRWTSLQIDKKCVPSARPAFAIQLMPKIMEYLPRKMAAGAEEEEILKANTVRNFLPSMKNLAEIARRWISTTCFLKAVQLLREHPEARRTWSERFRYLQVDEFQDTNRHQEEVGAAAGSARVGMFAWWAMRINPSIAGAERTAATSRNSRRIFPARK